MPAGLALRVASAERADRVSTLDAMERDVTERIEEIKPVGVLTETVKTALAKRWLPEYWDLLGYKNEHECARLLAMRSTA